MEPRRSPPEYFLEIFADTNSVKDVLKGRFLLSIGLFCCFSSLLHVQRELSQEGALYRSLRLTVTGVLNLIFFHRYFPSIRPSTVDILDLTLPAINDAELETLIDSRVTSLVRQHLSSASNAYGGNGVRGRIAVEFFEKKRRRSGLWFGGLAGKGEEEVCWEIWTLDVTIATPRTESGMCLFGTNTLASQAGEKLL